MVSRYDAGLFGYKDLGELILSAIEQTLLSDGLKLADFGGSATTSEIEHQYAITSIGSHLRY